MGAADALSLADAAGLASSDLVSAAAAGGTLPGDGATAAPSARTSTPAEAAEAAGCGALAIVEEARLAFAEALSGPVADGVGAVVAAALGDELDVGAGADEVAAGDVFADGGAVGLVSTLAKALVAAADTLAVVDTGVAADALAAAGSEAPLTEVSAPALESARAVAATAAIAFAEAVSVLWASEAA